MRASLGARVFDPLWMLTRQWQTGEFQAEDTGAPVVARVRATSAMLTRCALGEVPHDTIVKAPTYDPLQIPLEAMVERRPMRAVDENDPRMLGFAVEAGLHFLHLLDAQPLSKTYRAAFITRFAMQRQPAPDPDANDPATTRWLQTMVGRALDGRRLASTLRVGGTAAVTGDPALQIAIGDQAEVTVAATTWLAWYDALATEPGRGAADAWVPDRMEYAVSVAARLSPKPEDEITLSASEIDQGRLDWTSFDINAEINMGTDDDHATIASIETVVPAPVTFRGTPAPRFWELEDARIDYGLMPVGPTDLVQLLLIEYTGGYGNDWFVLPLTLPIGSLTRIDSLVVTDSFGVKSLLRPIGDPALPPPHWSMWQMAYRRRAGQEPIASPKPISSSWRPSPGSASKGSRSRTCSSCATRWPTSRGESSARSRARSSKRCSASSATRRRPRR